MAGLVIFCWNNACFKQTQQKAIHHRGTEFYFINYAYGVVNNTKLFSVLSVVTKWHLVFDCQAI